MKKILLSLFSVATFGAFAQADVGVTLTAPTSGATITAGTQFTYTADITNLGTEPIDAADSIIYAPTLNGNLIGNGQGGVLAFFRTGLSLTTGQSTNVSSTLNLSGGTGGSVDFCVVVLEMRGLGWNGVTQTNTANDEDCAAVTYDPGSNISVGEWTVFSTEDKSFYNNGTFHVRMSNYNFTTNSVLEVYNMTGAAVYSTPLANNGSSIEEDVNLASLKNGMYIVRINGGVKASATHKILVK
jgi:hypothetical protein